jgi:hypothetical protein
MKLAHKKMDCYYSLTDSSHAYRITMILHPGMKLDYFCNQMWEEDWIEQAETLVREEYAAKYENPTEVPKHHLPGFNHEGRQWICIIQQPFCYHLSSCK